MSASSSPGFVQGRILEELYSNAYAYCLPSDLEGMPLSLLEAMSYGCCCIVSDIAECTEVVEDKAVVFKKSDVKDLRNKMQQLCDKPEMVCGYKNTAADFILRKYNWDKVVGDTLKLYLRCDMRDGSRNMIRILQCVNDSIVPVWKLC